MVKYQFNHSMRTTVPFVLLCGVFGKQPLSEKGFSSANCDVFLLLQELTTEGAFFIPRADSPVTIIGILVKETKHLGRQYLHICSFTLLPLFKVLCS